VVQLCTRDPAVLSAGESGDANLANFLNPLLRFFTVIRHPHTVPPDRVTEQDVFAPIL
jgi:hypothetical protein